MCTTLGRPPFVAATCIAALAIFAIVVAAYIGSAYATRGKLLMRDRIRSALGETFDLLNKNCVPFVLAYGTLLGHVRERNVIDGDGDGDVAVHWSDAERVARLATRDRRLRVYRNRAHPDVIEFMRYRATPFSLGYVDIYVIHPCLESGNPERGCTLIPHHFCKSLPLGTPATWRVAEFLGHSVRVPRDTAEFLTQQYGADYMTPRPGYKGPAACEQHHERDYINNYAARLSALFKAGKEAQQ